MGEPGMFIYLPTVYLTTLLAIQIYVTPNGTMRKAAVGL